MLFNCKSTRICTTAHALVYRHTFHCKVCQRCSRLHLYRSRRLANEGDEGLNTALHGEGALVVLVDAQVCNGCRSRGRISAGVNKEGLRRELLQVLQKALITPAATRCSWRLTFAGLPLHGFGGIVKQGNQHRNSTCVLPLSEERAATESFYNDCMHSICVQNGAPKPRIGLII